MISAQKHSVSGCSQLWKESYYRKIGCCSTSTTLNMNTALLSTESTKYQLNDNWERAWLSAWRVGSKEYEYLAVALLRLPPSFNSIIFNCVINSPVILNYLWNHWELKDASRLVRFIVIWRIAGNRSNLLVATRKGRTAKSTEKVK